MTGQKENASAMGMATTARTALPLLWSLPFVFSALRALPSGKCTPPSLCKFELLAQPVQIGVQLSS